MNQLDYLTAAELDEYTQGIIAKDKLDYPAPATNSEGKTAHEYCMIKIAHAKSPATPIFAMPLQDAMRLCSDSSTSWVNSMAVFYKLVLHHDAEYPIKFKKFIKDNGSMDAVIEKYGLRKIEPAEMKTLFAPFGIIGKA